MCSWLPDASERATFIIGSSGTSELPALSTFELFAVELALTRLFDSSPSGSRSRFRGLDGRAIVVDISQAGCRLFKLPSVSLVFFVGREAMRTRDGHVPGGTLHKQHRSVSAYKQSSYASKGREVVGSSD